MTDAFPKIEDDIDVVFDLAGSISKSAKSITSAIEQSSIVFVPIYNEVKAINAGLNTIAEVLHFNPNVAIIATKLQRRGSADRNKAWMDCADYQNIKQAVHTQL